MADVSIVNQWLKKADKDLLIAESDIKVPQRAEYAAFNCQQAAEKYLKAYIIANNLKFKYTHDLVNLLQTCARKDKDFNTLRPLAEDLTPLYIETRYPEFVGFVTQKRAKTALNAARKIAEFIKGKLK